MAARRSPEGPFPYPTHETWVAHLCEAIINTCADEGFAPVPQQAVFDGLAPALGRDEAKRVVERRRDGRRYLRATAYHVEQRGTDAALLLLNVALHGAATLPWANNDRTRSGFLPPSSEYLGRLDDLVGKQRLVAGCILAVDRAKAAQRSLSATAAVAEKSAAVAAVISAQEELDCARAELDRCDKALGGRRPLPVVRAVVEDGVALAALTTEEVGVDVAAELQRYAGDMLERQSRLRPYDLVESLAQEGQREATVVVLQATPVIDRDGTRRVIWRGRQVTGNNRGHARLTAFGLTGPQLLTGVPQSALRLPGEEENRRLVLLGLGEVLRRVSTRLNAEFADSDRDVEGAAERAFRIAQVAARVVVGAAQPQRLEESLRQLNVHDHLRGQLPYQDVDRNLGLWSSLVNAYQAKGLLGELLAREITGGRVAAGELDQDAIADALVGARALDELAVLLTPGDEVSALTLRDVAVRCATVLVFPPVPPRPANLRPGAHMPTGRYWPVVRTALQEASWASKSMARAERRTDVWAAVVAQHFVHRRNPLAARGLFTARSVQYGVQVDGRSLASLLTACRHGDAEAWELLVRQHLVPGLIHAAEPFVTAGQGSETAANRKGVRRAPSNAVQALVNAYADPPQGVTRELLLAFAEAVLHAPDAPAGDRPEQGTFWAPDAHGNPREGVLADKAWFDTVFPKLPSKGMPPGATDKDAEDDSSPGDGGSGPVTAETEEEAPETAAERMTRLRREVISLLDTSRSVVDTAAGQVELLVQTVMDAVQARKDAGEAEMPADYQKTCLEDVRALRKQCEVTGKLLDAATDAVMSL
jgi:hypothetical protein